MTNATMTTDGKRGKQLLFVASLVISLLLLALMSLPRPALASNQVEEDDSVRFIYVGNGKAQIDSTQSVVVGFDDTADIQSAVLHCVAPDGDQLAVSLAKSAEGACLFQFDLPLEGTYQLTSIDVMMANAEAWRSYALCDESGNEYSSFIASSEEEELSPIPKSSEYQGVFLADGQSAISLYQDEKGSRSSSFVVVLDPGHGGGDSGAVANGLQEKNLTLKIALYCKQELQKYNNVQVIMTRDTDSSVSGSSNVATELHKRCDIARDNNSDLYVSFHINSGGGTGAEVWIPNSSSWHYSFHELGDQLGNSILTKLGKLGLSSRGNKDSEYGGLYYSDGSDADGLAVIRYCREYGIPSLLIEHGFIDNSHDASLLSSEWRLQQMGIADARAIAEQYGLTSGQWVEEGGKWHWYEGDSYVVDDWRTIDGEIFWFGDDGVAVRGWQEIGSEYYYFNKDSAALTYGWLDEGGKRYRLDRDDGHLWTGWYTVDGVWHYSNPDGSLVESGWATGADGGTYWLDEGATSFRRGWLDEGGKRYRLDRDDGHLWTGWYTVDGVSYHSADDGALTYGWLDEGGKRYRLDRDDGHLWTGWYTVDGVWYYADSTGALMLDSGWHLVGDRFYYYDENGKCDVSRSQPAYSVMGESSVTAEELAANYRSKGKKYPASDLSAGGAGSIDEFCKIVVEEAQAEGVRQEVLFFQIMNETGWLQFGGDVSVSQYNFGGLGATGGVPGLSFSDVRTGIRAQVQHLKAYGSTEPLRNECVDLRFGYVDRGCAKYVQWLGIQENPQRKGWAASKGYGATIVGMIADTFPSLCV